jgi:hypothetical protein
MDLQYVAGSNAQVLDKLVADGYDLDTLFYTCKDVFNMLDDVEIGQPSEVEDFFFRLKNGFDAANGVKVEPDYVLYENSRSFPSRLAV